jgi:hypothetical protein
VLVDGKYGFIDTAGEVAVAPQFHMVDSFRNGKANVMFEDYRRGYIDG